MKFPCRLLCNLLVALFIFNTQAALAEATAPATARPRVALALGGGGTRGAAHVGVLRVLQKEGIAVDCIAGTSMGAIVGGLYSAGVDVDTIENTFTKKYLLKAFYTVPIPVRIAAIPLFAAARLLGARPYDGFYRGGRFANFLNNSVPAAEREIQDLQIPFAAVCLNLLDGKACTLTSGNLGRALQASAAVPVLRRPVDFDENKLLVDGGMKANLPVRQARDMGADIVIAVDVDEQFQPVDKEVFRQPESVSRRLVNMLLADMDADQQKNADVVIHPDVDGITLLSTRIKDARAAIKAGEEAARAAIPAIKEKIANFKPPQMNVQNDKPAAQRQTAQTSPDSIAPVVENPQ